MRPYTTLAEHRAREIADQALRRDPRPRRCVALATTAEHPPADLDALARELTEALAFIGDKRGCNRVAGSAGGGRAISWQADWHGEPVADPERLRAALERICRQHCGPASSVTVTGLDAVAPVLRAAE